MWRIGCRFCLSLSVRRNVSATQSLPAHPPGIGWREYTRLKSGAILNHGQDAHGTRIMGKMPVRRCREASFPELKRQQASALHRRLQGGDTLQHGNTRWFEEDLDSCLRRNDRVGG